MAPKAKYQNDEDRIKAIRESQYKYSTNKKWKCESCKFETTLNCKLTIKIAKCIV